MASLSFAPRSAMGQRIPRPLITSQEHRPSNADPGHSRTKTSPECTTGSSFFLGNLPHDMSNADLVITFPSSRKHHPRLNHVQRSRQSRCNRSSNAPKQCTGRCGNRNMTIALRGMMITPPLLHRLPKTELQNSKRNLPGNRNPSSPVKFPNHHANSSSSLLLSSPQR